MWRSREVEFGMRLVEVPDAVVALLMAQLAQMQ